jgi:hypothetical protein
MMRTIETVVTISPDGKFTVQLPPDIPPGDRRIVLVIDDQVLTSSQSKKIELDAAFAEMANDPDYQQESQQIEAEFAASQWDALQLSEAESGQT